VTDFFESASFPCVIERERIVRTNALFDHFSLALVSDEIAYDPCAKRAASIFYFNNFYL
jgi:hypothetical protein